MNANQTIPPDVARKVLVETAELLEQAWPGDALSRAVAAVARELAAEVADPVSVIGGLYHVLGALPTVDGLPLYRLMQANLLLQAANAAGGGS